MLSAREIQVARLISRGRYEKEIAVQLHIAVGTVHAHSRSIREKWHASNIAEITRNYILTYDHTIRQRIRRAYQAGRSGGPDGRGAAQTSDQPATGIRNFWTRANKNMAQAWHHKPREARFADLLLNGRAGHRNQNKLTMTELQKIDILQWMYSELTLEQLKTLKQIAKDIARNEDKASARPAADLPAAGKRD